MDIQEAKFTHITLLNKIKRYFIFLIGYILYKDIPNINITYSFIIRMNKGEKKKSDMHIHLNGDFHTTPIILIIFTGLLQAMIRAFILE